MIYPYRVVNLDTNHVDYRLSKIGAYNLIVNISDCHGVNYKWIVTHRQTKTIVFVGTSKECKKQLKAMLQ